jgi:Flp pilus assembly protein TadB
VIVALVCGAGVGAGLLAVARGLFAPRPSLAEALTLLRRAPGPAPALAPTEEVGFATRLGRPLAALVGRAGADALVRPALRRDLAVVGRSPERHLAEKVTLGLVGFLLAPAMAALAALGGARVPLVLPVWAALACGLLGFFAPDLGVRSEAKGRRADFRHALGSFLDLVVIALAAGGGIETALTSAAATGRGWAYGELRRALEEARLARESPWAALERLGETLGVDELGELAASIGLAGSEGAKVRASLGAKAVSLRAHQLAEAEGAAEAATEKMSLPVVFLFAGFLCFIGFPAVVRVLAGF